VAVYEELRRLAAAYMRRERPGQTLQATALVHEAYLRLAGAGSPWADRKHFLGIAARSMRQILVDRARARGAQKRWAGLNRVSLTESLAAAADEDAMLPALDEAITKLEQLDPEQARIVELRYFVGLGIEETAVFATSEVLLGIVPGVISPYVIRKIGLAAATPLMLTGRQIEAREAAASGLATKVASAAELENALQAVVLDFLAAGPEAQRRTKELLKRTQPLPGPELIDFTAEAIAQARCSPEGRKGLEAFFSKAPPAWAARVEALRKSSSRGRKN